MIGCRAAFALIAWLLLQGIAFGQQTYLGSLGETQYRYFLKIQKDLRIPLSLDPKPVVEIPFLLDASGDRLNGFDTQLLLKLRRSENAEPAVGIWDFAKHVKSETYRNKEPIGVATFTRPVSNSSRNVCMFYYHVLFNASAGYGELVQVRRGPKGWRTEREVVLDRN